MYLFKKAFPHVRSVSKFPRTDDACKRSSNLPIYQIYWSWMFVHTKNLTQVSEDSLYLRAVTLTVTRKTHNVTQAKAHTRLDTDHSSYCMAEV